MTLAVEGVVRRSVPAGAVLAVACAATFVSFLDLALVNLAFPQIAADFPVGISTLTWVVSAYTVAFAAFLAAFGRLADTLGHQKVLLVGVLVVALSSLGCAIAPTIEWLIAARAVQGIAGAALLPASLGAVLATMPSSKVPAAIGAWSAAGALAAAIGPAAGAVIVEFWGWRATFVAVAAACVLLGAAVVLWIPAHTNEPIEGRKSRLPDMLGVALLAAGVGMIVAAVSEAGRWGWSHPVTVMLFVVGLSALCTVVIRGSLHPRPALEVSLWHWRPFAWANVISAVLGHGLFAYLLAAPLFLITIWHLSLMQAAGCVGAAGGLAMIAAGVAGRFITVHNATWFTGVGLMLKAAGFAVVAGCFGEQRSFALWALVAVLLGVGMGLAITALSVITAAAGGVDSAASAIGLNLTARSIGGAIGVAVLAAVLTDDHYVLASFHRLFAVLAAVAACGAIAAVRLRIPIRDKSVSSFGDFAS
ncbi:MFS transporter [Nocardia sp. XZ_19_231]|uniref:MFS transporter n=1 Tax=Nocardia sp. XZ_19_231 TaxID=2769252 RepID=UPI001890278E|nr:MFS transporter [Nocardia sp. XZ_19_231]